MEQRNKSEAVVFHACINEAHFLNMTLNARSVCGSNTK
jgi:hypothetical protein